MSQVPAALVLRFLDVVMVLLVVEFVGLAAYRAATGRGMRTAEAAAFLGAGSTMVLAMRVTVAGGPVEWFAAAMAASLALHVWHVAQRRRS